MFGSVLRFMILCFVKVTRYWCYPTTSNWVSPPPPESWHDVRLILILNHTSLMEYIYATAMPVSYLWQMSRRLVFPVADVTLEKPQGKLLKLFAPRVISLTRKRDDSWQDFLDQLQSDDILIFMPEGRMKRRNGLDKHGQPMTMKTGICDLLPRFSGERMIIAYSGGLHHVLAPGQRISRPFQKLTVNLESVDVDTFLESFAAIADETSRRGAICRELERRRDKYCVRE